MCRCFDLSQLSLSISCHTNRAIYIYIYSIQCQYVICMVLCSLLSRVLKTTNLRLALLWKAKQIKVSNPFDEKLVFLSLFLFLFWYANHTNLLSISVLVETATNTSHISGFATYSLHIMRCSQWNEYRAGRAKALNNWAKLYTAGHMVLPSGQPFIYIYIVRCVKMHLHRR